MSVTTTTGPSTLGILGVVFIVLKLCGVIHWSWWWVMAPFWAPVVLFAGAGLLFLLIYFLFMMFGNRNGNWWK